MAKVFQENSFPKRACLSGKDLSDLIEGKVIMAYGKEFCYDGTEISKVWMSADSLRKRSDGDKHQKSSK